MTAEGTFPKIDGDILYASEANMFAGFGDGSDGAFSETSGTTSLTGGTVYQYTTFTLDTSATLNADGASQEPIIILVRGNCVINGTIDLTTFGATASYGTEGTVGGAPTAGVKLPILMNFQLNQKSIVGNGTKGGTSSGAGVEARGGGGGASSQASGSAGTSGGDQSSGTVAGGTSGMTIFIICGGTLTLGASSSIDVSGTDAAATSDFESGGGGGAGGDIIIFHNGAKTDNGLTTDVTAGSGAAGSGASGGGDGGGGAAGQVKIAAFDTILW